MARPSLRGARVCMVLIAEYPHRNSRAIKQSESLRAAGAVVSMVCVGPGDSKFERHFDSVRWIEPSVPSTVANRALRVAANLSRARRQTVQVARAITLERPDLIHAHFLNTLAAAERAAGAVGARLVYDPRDLYVETIRATRSARQVRYFTRLESRLIRSCDLVLTVSEPFEEFLLDNYGDLNTVLVYNGPIRCLEQESAVEGPVKLLFQGAFRWNRNLAALIDAMESMRGKATLTLQGWGDEEAALRQQVQSKGLGDVVMFESPCGPLDVVASAARFDVGVICYRGTTANLEVAVPNKLMDYIGAGLAVAASDLPGHRSIIDKYRCGVLIDPTSPATIASGLGVLAANRDRLSDMKRASSAACGDLCWERQAERMVRAFAGILEGRR